MKMEDIAGGRIKIGNTTYNMVEAKYNGTVVWPAAQPVVISYAIVSGSIVFTFSSGYQLNAAGTNYATATGSIQEYHNGTAYGNPFTAAVTPRLPSGSPLSLSGNKIYGPYLGNNETSQETYTVYFSYQGSSYTSAALTQEANVKTRTSINAKVYNYSSSVTTESDSGYYLESFTASPYHDSSYPCPASGGTTTLSYQAGHTHNVTVTTPWTRTANYSFSSGATSTEAYDSGMEVTSNTSTAVTDTPTISGSATGFSRSGNTVTIANRSTTTGAQRSVTYTATNGGITRTVTIYQAANEVSYTYNLSVDIDVTGTIGYLGGRYDVNYVSKRTPTYSSGAPGTEESCTSSVSTSSNCTPEVASVSGSGTFGITVDENTSTSLQPTVTVTISCGGHTASDSATQDAKPIVIVPKAVVYADVNSNGRTRLRFVMTQGTTTFPVVLEDVVYYWEDVVNYTPSSGSGNIGTVTITEDGAAVNLPMRYTWLSGTSGTHYFDASSVSQIGKGNTTFRHDQFEIR